jgi:DNA-binding LacI/PurR family transcriptional regulator
MNMETKNALVRRPVNGGRAAAKLAAQLRSEISGGRIASGDYLLTERQLAEQHGVARMTVRRALKALETDGLIAAEPRHGYRVLARATDPDRGFPVAYVLSVETRGGTWDPFHQNILTAFQRAASGRNWALLGVTSGGRSQREVLEQLRAARVGAVALDTVNSELIEMVRADGMAAVMVDAWIEDSPFDLVLQDNYRGAFLAARHLAARGHRRVAWVGSVGRTGHSRERFAGAVAALVAAGIELPPEMRMEVTDGQARAATRELLGRADRPTGILCLWRGLSLEVAEEIAAQGLVLGRDVEIVGWCPEEDYAEYREAAARIGPVPPAVAWSVGHLARMAMARLAERREDMSLPPVRLCVPAMLRLPENG